MGLLCLLPSCWAGSVVQGALPLFLGPKQEWRTSEGSPWAPGLLRGQGVGVTLLTSSLNS